MAQHKAFGKTRQMHCCCDELPRFTYWDPERGAALKLRPFAKRVGQANWRNLLVCELCNCHWRTDEFDKYNQGFVLKLGAYQDDWAELSTEPEEKQLLLETRGGVLNEPCVWANCGKPKVKGSAYCIDHLYETGVRR